MSERKNKRWSEEEVKYLKENYKEFSIRELASYFGRTERGVRAKAERIGLKLSDSERREKIGGGKGNSYTQKEVEFLKENYSKKTDEEMAKELDRTKESIGAKRARLGLYKNNRNYEPGEKFTDGDGYIKIYDEQGNKRFYHKVVAENMLGRELKEEEKVHHINMDKHDNRKENLYVCRDRSEHYRTHHQANELLGKLVKKGVIKFDRDKGEYCL